MSRGYYQLGGFRPAIQWFHFDEKRLADTLAGDESPLRPTDSDPKAPIELALGIKRSGTSHLLLTESETRLFVHHLRLQGPRAPPTPATEFESISPIYFRDADELSKKLGTLRYKSQKGRAPADNSQANRHYLSGEDGIQRGGFELGRLFYGVIQNTIDPGKYGVADVSWASSVRVCSFVFNTRSNDQRHSSERLLNPIILDFGWSEATIPDMRIKAGTSGHIMLRENRFLSRGSEKLKFKHGTTEELDSYNIQKRFRDMFGDQEHPVVLLVHGEQITRNALKKFGVNTLHWKSGIKGLLGIDNRKTRDPRARGKIPGVPYGASDEYEERAGRPRSRSQSPRASVPSQRSSTRYAASASGSRAQPPSDSYAPVYMVDIRELYVKLMQTEHDAESVVKIAQHMGLSEVDGWCAGNESVLIIETWRSMASGPAIDEQRAARASGPPRASGAEEEDEEDDEERDPNDIVQVAAAESDSDDGASDSD